MSAVDEYLTARAEAAKIAARVSRLAQELTGFSEALRLEPYQASPRIPQNWQTREDWQTLLNDAMTAWTTMRSLYNQIPNDQRQFVSPPLLGMRG
jgi:hypothetical protein